MSAPPRGPSASRQRTARRVSRLLRPGAFSMRSARLKTPASFPSASVMTKRALPPSIIRSSASRRSAVSRQVSGGELMTSAAEVVAGANLLGDHPRREVTIRHDSDDLLAAVTDGQEAHPGLRHQRGSLQDAVLLGQPLEILVHDVSAFHGPALLVGASRIAPVVPVAGGHPSGASAQGGLQTLRSRRERPQLLRALSRRRAPGARRSHWHAT